MKVRQVYEGRVIEARSSELRDGGWDCEFSIEEHEAAGETETAFYVPGVFPTAEAAIQAAVKAGQDAAKLFGAHPSLLRVGVEQSGTPQSAERSSALTFLTLVPYSCAQQHSTTA